MGNGRLIRCTFGMKTAIQNLIQNAWKRHRRQRTYGKFGGHAAKMILAASLYRAMTYDKDPR